MSTQTRQGRWAVSALFAANGFVMGAWAPQIPLLLPRHQITEGTLGLLILSLGAGAVGAMALSGGLVSRYGTRPVVRAFSLAAVPVLALVVLAPTLPLVVLAMVLMGAMIGCMDVAMNANAVEVERALGRAIMSSCHGFWSLGGFAGAGLGGLAIARLGASGHAVAACAAVAVVTVVALPFVMQGAGPTAQDADTPERRWPRGWAIWVLGLMALGSMVPEGAVLDWAALYLRKEHGADVATASLAFALFSGTMAVMRFAGDAVRGRFGAVATLRVSALIAAAGLLGAALSPVATVAIVCFGFTGLGVANMIPVLFSAAGNMPGLRAGVGITTVTMMGYSGILVAPSSIGYIAEHVGFRATFAAMAVILLAVAALAGRAAAADGVQPSTAPQAPM